MYAGRGGGVCVYAFSYACVLVCVCLSERDECLYVGVLVLAFKCASIYMYPSVYVY